MISTHLAPVACLSRAIRDALLPGARLLLCRMLLLLLLVVVLLLLLVIVLVLLQVVARGLDGRHVVVELATPTAVVVVVHGSLDRHGGSADVVVLRRSCAKVLGVFRLTSSPFEWRALLLL
jgi:hypothetical protein